MRIPHRHLQITVPKNPLQGQNIPAIHQEMTGKAPQVVFEFKSTIHPGATIHDAYRQLTTRYARDIPELMKYNTRCTISDGVNSRMGSPHRPGPA